MIKQLTSVFASTPPNPLPGNIIDSVAFGNYICLIGQFTQVNGFPTYNVALINSTTGLLDTTSALAIALSTFLPAVYYNNGTFRVLADTSNGHPCLIFATTSGVFVFYTDTLVGFNLISTVITDMQIGTNNRSLVLLLPNGSPVGIYSGCVVFNLDAMAPYGTGLSAGYLTSSPTKVFTGLAVDDTDGVVFLSIDGTTPTIEAYSILAFTFSYISNTPRPHATTGEYVRGKLSMAFSGGQLYVGASSGNMYWPIYNCTISYSAGPTIGYVWGNGNIVMTKNQAFGNIYPRGIKIYKNKLYVWGGFTNAFYPAVLPSYASYTYYLSVHARQGVAVFDISSGTPNLIGEDISLSYGVVYLTYVPPISYNAYEQSATVACVHIDDSGAYVFSPSMAHAYSTDQTHQVGLNIQNIIFRNGIQINAMPLKLDTVGHDTTQLFDANMIFS